ncbi:hypothetical protein IX56_18050 [Paracoccus sanguinis]|uniref:Uncharacterized protein n=1 Tax=Paracoccus sanguinis TaxID=1545044 RepID=A0A099G182_9RHOB|nr:hypothetical protein IX56_18050 [Paracoccus sanguinis]
MSGPGATGGRAAPRGRPGGVTGVSPARAAEMVGQQQLDRGATGRLGLAEAGQRREPASGAGGVTVEPGLDIRERGEQRQPAALRGGGGVGATPPATFRPSSTARAPISPP